MTASEFLALPESNLPHELINGEEIMSPSPTTAHPRFLIRVLDLLRSLIPDGEVLIAPLDVYLDEANVLQPDLLWISAGNTNVLIQEKYIHGAPDMIVEIFSPGTARRDKRDKFKLYEKFCVREYWMVDPDQKLLEIWQLKDDKFVLVDVFGSDDPCQSPLLGTVNLRLIFPD